VHNASDSELDVAVFRIGFVNSLAIGVSEPKYDLLPFTKSDEKSEFRGADCVEEVFPL
jgi:hypothetical protein